MAVAKDEVIQMSYQNPDATNPLFLPVLVIANTPDKIIERNIRINSAKDLRWLRAEEPNDKKAILVGGGYSIREEIDTIKSLQDEGGVVFAMNGASRWLRENGVEVDYQCIIDAKEESAGLVDKGARQHLFGSQVDPLTMDSVESPIVWHLAMDNVEDLFPQERRKRGGYVLLGGGAAVGNSSLCAAYAMGFRDLHIFGMDSCHRGEETHAYHQFMNRFIPTVDVKWGDKEFTSSVAMKIQAEKFQITSQALKEEGCDIHVYGEGLLQTMYRTKFDKLTEQQKYQYMWAFDAYRDHSPGERIAAYFLEQVRPDSLVIDYGCGTGRGSLAIHKAGVNVMLIDFADNCRDEEALSLPFIQWDLTKPLYLRSEYGFCTDVMEHIPTEDVETVIDNIMSSSKKVFFQISTVEDDFGSALDECLHLTVKDHQWWMDMFNGYTIEFSLDLGIASIFYVMKECQC